MERLLVCIFTVLCLVSGSIGKKGFGPGEQEWGFIQVRPNIHIFWWLYYTTANVTSYYDKPLIIWLQGGPGMSSTSIGNFVELGPLDMDQNPRNYTWVKNYNVLFIDNPVGTGFSYIENLSENIMDFATTNVQIANDLLECIRGFYEQLPEFKPVPTYITTEGYGGKMGAEFALVWDQAQKAGTIESNLKGIMLGSPWISPIDSVLTWGLFLLSTGVVDSGTFKVIDYIAKMAKDHVEAGRWTNATKSIVRTTSIILEETSSVDFFNILTKRDYSYHLLSENRWSFDLEALHRDYFQDEVFDNFMNGPVKEALGLNVSHGQLSQFVYSFLYEDIMKPVTNIVERLLNETDLHVFVYNGQLDLLVNTQGTLRWVEKLKWKQARNWRTVACRKPLIFKNIVEGYFKIHGNFGMYWVNRAGHMVPRDNPAAMEIILQDLVSNANQKQRQELPSSTNINIKNYKMCDYP